MEANPTVSCFNLLMSFDLKHIFDWLLILSHCQYILWVKPTEVFVPCRKKKLKKKLQESDFLSGTVSKILVVFGHKNYRFGEKYTQFHLIGGLIAHRIYCEWPYDLKKDPDCDPEKLWSDFLETLWTLFFLESGFPIFFPGERPPICFLNVLHRPC